VVARDAGDVAVPEELAARNWIFLRPFDDREAGVGSLVRALDTDLDWVRKHTRLLVRATEWSAGDRDPSLLLRGKDLDDAEAELAAAADREPPVAPLQAEYALASRQAASQRQRNLTRTAVAVVVVMALLAAYAFRQAGEARKQRDTAISRQLVSQAEALVPTDPSLALVLALQAHQRHASADTEAVVRQAAAVDHVVARPISEPVAGASLSRDGKRVAWVTSADGSVGVSASDGSDVQEVGHHPGATRLAWLGDDGVVTAAPDGSVRVWADGKERALDLDEEVTLLDGSPDGAYVALATTGGRVLLWPVADKAAKELGTTDGPPLMIRFSDDGKLLGAAGNRARLVRYRIPDGQRTVQETVGVTDPVTVFDADGELKTTATNTSPDFLFLSFAPSAEAPVGRTAPIAVHGIPRVVRYNGATGQVAVDEGTAGIALYDETTISGEPVRLVGPRGSVDQISFSPEGDRLATGGTAGVVIFDTTPRQFLEPESGTNGVAALSPDGKLVAVGSNFGMAILDRSTGETVAEDNLLDSSGSGANADGTLTSVTRMAVAPDGTSVLVGINDGRILRWPTNGDSYELLADLDGSPNALGWLGDRPLVLEADGDVVVFDGEDVHTMVDHDRFGPVTSMAVGPDGDLVVLGGTGRIGIVTAKDGKTKGELSGFGASVVSVAVSPDGGSIAAGGSDGVIRRFDLASGKAIGSLEGHTGDVSTIGFGEGELLYSGGNDGTLRIWDLRTAHVLVVLQPHNSRITSMAVDGRDVLTASADFGGGTAITTCDVCGPFDELLKRLGERPQRQLSDEERARYGM
jgi:WD40 repeat protein